MPSKYSTSEAEQRYYIEKIFDRYGENGRLSFFGLEKLLLSLGLGEVKVVMINHDDIGHDHVSHLYALEVQEGKRSHPHNHPHSHPDSENRTTTGMAAKRNHKCDPERDAVVPPVKDDGKHIHDQSHHHHRHHPRLHHHDHNGTRHSRSNGHQGSSLGHEDGHHHPSNREASHKQISVRKHALFSARARKEHSEEERQREEVSMAQRTGKVTLLLLHKNCPQAMPRL